MLVYNTRMNYYFVDYENIGAEGLNGIKNLGDNNTVFIFYSRNADKITFDIHNQINASEAAIHYYKVEAGHKNALDFQLASYLGYVIRENLEGECSYFIVSKDTGFTTLLTFWKKQNVSIEIVADLTGQKVQLSPAELEQEIASLTNDTKNAHKIAEIIRTSKTKQDVNNALTKNFPGTKIYSMIKPLIEDKESS